MRHHRQWSRAAVLVVLTGLTLAAWPPTVARAEQQPLYLGLDETVSRAQEVSPRLDELTADLRAAEAGLSGARAQRLPNLSLEAGYRRWNDVPEFLIPTPPGQPPAEFPNIPNEWRFRLGVVLPVYTGGRLESEVESADRRREAATSDCDTGEADLVLETRLAYWELVVAQEAEAVFARAIEGYEAHLLDARNRQEVGLAAANDVLMVEVQRHRAELERMRAATATRIARDNLARLLALPGGTLIEPTEQLAQTASLPLDPAALVATALATRSERTALLLRIEAARLQGTAARSGRLPSVGVSAGYALLNPDRRVLPPEAEFKNAWDVSVNMVWSVFDSGRSSAAVEQATARVQALEFRLEELDSYLQLEVTAQADELSTADAAAWVAERGVESGRENLRVSRDRFREGLIPSSELLDAETALMHAELDRTRSLVSIHRSRARLDRAVGR